MKYGSRMLATLVLLVSLVLSICPEAFAYSSGQYYMEDTSLQRCITVQVSAVNDYNGAVKRRDKMLKAGYDSFVYQKGDVYRIMCGKFYSMDDAEDYLDSIKANTDRSKAYLTNAYLPAWAIEDFQDEYEWEDYFNDYGDLRRWGYDEDQYYKYHEDRVKVYTVQVSADASRSGAEKRRDKMLNAGYDSFVYKYNGTYRVMCGKFYAMEDAEAYLASIKANTDRDRAYITNARMTRKAIQRFEDIYWG